jgi:hypothetical protein
MVTDGDVVGREVGVLDGAMARPRSGCAVGAVVGSSVGAAVGSVAGGARDGAEDDGTVGR